MDITITPSPLKGNIAAIPSKSVAHRLLICAAFADKPTSLHCPKTNQDMNATANCLTALGAEISHDGAAYIITPAKAIPSAATLNCGESGSTLRFMLPIVGALGVDATFLLAGRLPQRPLSPLWEEMERMGCRLFWQEENKLRCQGKLQPGAYRIDGGVSSQFVTGLLFALSLMNEKSYLSVTGHLESKPYVDMTKQALASFGVDPEGLGGQTWRSPGNLVVEGDWSNAAFFLAAQALGNEVAVTGLQTDSRQGDRAVVSLLYSLKKGSCVIDCSHIPDLVPILAVAAGALNGAVFTNVQRLRLKESDRIASTGAMLSALGGKWEATDATLTVYPTGYFGGTVDCAKDHRIAMSAAIAASICKAPVTLLGAEAVNKSYPDFWEEYRRLGGIL